MSYAYPQPAKNTLVFNFELSSAAAVKIYVYNISGIPVAVFEKPGIAGYNNPGFDISQFPPGVYYYIIKAGDKKFSPDKFLVER